RWSGCSSLRSLIADARCVDVPRIIHHQRGDFLLVRAVQHECIPRWGDAVDQATAVRPSDHVVLCRGRQRLSALFIGAFSSLAGWLESQGANVRLIALEEKRTLTVLLDLIDLAMITRGDIQPPGGRIKCQVPNILGFGIKKDTRFVTGVNRNLTLRFLGG